MKCAICGEGNVTEHSEEHVYEVGRTIYAAPLRYSTCDVCKSDYTTQEQAWANKRSIAKVSNDQFKTDF